MYSIPLMASDFQLSWLQEAPNNDLYGSSNLNNTEASIKMSDQPSLSFYTPNKPGPLHPSARVKSVTRLFSNGNDSIDGLDEVAMELGRRLDELHGIPNWGDDWIIPLGMIHTAKQYKEEQRLRNERLNEDGNEDDDHYANQSSNQNDSVDATQALVENAYARPAVPFEDRRSSRIVSGATMDESTTYEIGDVAIHDNSSTHEEEHDIEPSNSRVNDEHETERNLDAEMSYHDFLASDRDFSVSSSDDDEHADLHVNNNSYNNGASNRFVPEPLQSSFHDTDYTEMLHTLPPQRRMERESFVGDEHYFMAYEDYQNDHSIMEPSNKPNPISQRVVSFPDNTIIIQNTDTGLSQMTSEYSNTAPSGTAPSNNDLLQFTAQTSMVDDESNQVNESSGTYSIME